jgi:hypothetical protein
MLGFFFVEITPAWLAVGSFLVALGLLALLVVIYWWVVTFWP